MQDVQPTTLGRYTVGLGRKPGPCGRCQRVVSGKKTGSWRGRTMMLCRDCKNRPAKPLQRSAFKG